MLITGDRHLLDLKSFRDVEILSPREFVELLDHDANRKST
jgi:predicted nucleic acid-binding protein